MVRANIDKSGKRDWIKHPIYPFNSQFHILEWIDLDGDGNNELVTGKRYRAHNNFVLYNLTVSVEVYNKQFAVSARDTDWGF